MRYFFIVSIVLLFGCGPAEDNNQTDNQNNGESEPTFFSADSATASSEWSSAYLVEYAIDGSGLPDDFGPDDVHADYSQNNHWTTADGDVEGAWARFEFDDPVTIDTFWMWNHLSNSPTAYSADYAVSLFDLEFFDAEDNSIAELTELTAQGNTFTAQEYNFDTMEDVSAVLFTVRTNEGEPLVTGLAEVLFSFTP